MKKYSTFIVIGILAVLAVFILKNIVAIVGVAVVFAIVYFFIIKPWLEADKKDADGPQAKE